MSPAIMEYESVEQWAGRGAVVRVDLDVRASDPQAEEKGSLPIMSKPDEMPPGYYWGTEQAPPEDADTADRVVVNVNYGVSVQEPDGRWRWSGICLSDRNWADDHAATYLGTNDPVPVHRKVIEVTRTTYVWGDPEPAPADRVSTSEKHVVLSEHRYTGPSDPWADN